MPKQAKRQVKRVTPSQHLVSRYNQRAWYNLPDWARVWFAGAVGWIVLAMVIILLPAAMLALVAGFHSLPLEFLGVPALGNGVGVAAVSLLAEFILLVLAVSPLIHRKISGWYLALGASLVHLVHSIVLIHAISGVILTVVPVYLYFQTRRYFS